ncbi:hypothetical protein Cs7R123_54630 [Catellatospora sp. TT07R-123]|uniref:hypothetical protein n=1 Tax=Catellatospora sp. TT07R-123 TaxID=2733863 RepID=UPI001B29A8FB|nr:hypothetical protein [Catellatospora sp. TT07R-123]GHJ48121.1 hypothetical protein Cs7R123_54630 [Catellatospora sp. TT07R-123]
MRRFLGRRRTWPDGFGLLHVYLVPDLDRDRDLARLVDDCGRIMSGYDFIPPMAPHWIHATVAPVMGVPSATVDAAVRAEFASRLRAALSGVPAFTLTAGSPLAGASTVALDLDGDLPGQPLHTVYTLTRKVIGELFGPGALEYEAMPGHLTLAYASGAGDSGDVQSALRTRVRPSHAPMTVGEVHVVDVVQHRDPVTYYSWTVIDRIPLRAPERAIIGG